MATAPASKKTVRIEYCTSWGYLKRAAGLAENLLHDYHGQLSSVTMAPGATGSFEVFLGRKKVFSKQTLERFPETDEVETKVAELLEA